MLINLSVNSFTDLDLSNPIINEFVKVNIIFLSVILLKIFIYFIYIPDLIIK